MAEASSSLHIVGAMRTDPGLVRTLNEDSVVWVTPPEHEESRGRGSLALVADGMGGHAAGEVASALAADVIRRLYYDIDGPVPQVLANAFTTANRAILEYAAEHPECKGMGTTCTVLVFQDGKAWLAHIGDSREMCIRDSTSAYWFTASTSFANPAVTIARSLSDTFAGIAPTGVVTFITAQFLGMLAALALGRWLLRG